MIINILLALTIIQLPSFVLAAIITKYNLKKMGVENIDVHDKIFRVPFSFVYPVCVTFFITIYVYMSDWLSFF